MVGRKPSIFWQVSWRVTSPLIVLVILVFYLVTQVQKIPTYLVWDPNSVSTQACCLLITSQCKADSIFTVNDSGDKLFCLAFHRSSSPL